LPLQASRGSLLDRNMVVLAQSVPAHGVWYDGRRIGDAKDEDLRKLASILGLKPDRMIAQMRKDSKRAFVYLDRQVDSDVAAKAKALKIPGLGFVTESKRYYPQGETMAHLVGFTSIEDKGQEGVELAFNDRLTGEDGERNVLRDRLGNVNTRQKLRQPWYWMQKPVSYWRWPIFPHTTPTTGDSCMAKNCATVCSRTCLSLVQR